MADKKRILIVENDENWRLHLQSLLSDLGHPITLATTPLEATTRLAHTRFSLAIVDIELSQNDPTGIIVIAKIRETHPELPIIAISGAKITSQQMVAELFTKYNIFNFFWKPELDPTTFREVIV